MSTNTVVNLLALLSDKEFCSGEWLGLQLGITRSAIWKQLRLLESLGVPILSVKGKGYRLDKPLILLEKKKIINLLPEYLRMSVQVETCVSVGSTNDEVKHLALSDYRLNICAADHQRAGRGRQGRVWESPLGSNCYYSMLWSTERGFAALEGLSLVVGLALVRVLESFDIRQLGLKWPNDVLWQAKKLAGILIEVEGDVNGFCRVVIGIGVNLFLSEGAGRRITQPVTDLYKITGKIIDKNLLVARLTQKLAEYLVLFEQHGFSEFKKKWNTYDVYRGKQVSLVIGNEKYDGIAKGADDYGSLLVKTESGMECFSGGEVSLRPNELLN